MIFHLLFAGAVGVSTMYLSQSLPLAVAAGGGMAALRLLGQARSMWRDAQD